MGRIGALSLKTELSFLLQVGGKWGAGGGGGRGADHPFLQLRAKLNCEGHSST